MSELSHLVISGDRSGQFGVGDGDWDSDYQTDQMLAAQAEEAQQAIKDMSSPEARAERERLIEQMAANNQRVLRQMMLPLRVN